MVSVWTVIAYDTLLYVSRHLTMLLLCSFLPYFLLQFLRFFCCNFQEGQVLYVPSICILLYTSTAVWRVLCPLLEFHDKSNPLPRTAKHSLPRPSDCTVCKQVCNGHHHARNCLNSFKSKSDPRMTELLSVMSEVGMVWSCIYWHFYIYIVLNVLEAPISFLEDTHTKSLHYGQASYLV